MGIQAGSQLGSYKITSLIGKGGMGEVYRARDTKLKREVAIKVLPDEFSRDHDRVSRFQREAEVLASLNHPNIAAIYDLEEANETRFLVLELVEGETLAERIARGSMPIEEALDIAKHICDALEAAHEKGVVHRDLKPANVKMTPNGNVKVLDFGLAKAWAGDAADANMSNSPTLISQAATNAGVILGTAAYMSPEQAKGMKVDRRADIFAFGCVLFEMLTGRPTFDGEDVTEILGRVVTAEPDWNRLPPGTPPSIQRLLRRALKKDPRQRLGDIRDARIEIEEAKTAETPLASASARSARRTRITSLAIAAVLIVALGIPALRHLRETPSVPTPEMRTEIVTPSTTDPISFALSPDGRQLVFVASGDGQRRLWLRPLDAMTAQPLAGTEGASSPFWSPDSRSVGFFADDKLKRLDIGGGPPRTLTNAVPRGGTWNADGVILFARFGTQSPLFRISASGGEAVAVTKLNRATSHRFPYFLPDGRQFLFYAQGSPETGGIYLGSLDSVDPKRLTAADTAGVYMPSGWLLWVRAGTLVAQRLDLGTLAGDHPVTVADGVAFSAFGVGAVSVSGTGLVAYRLGEANRLQLTWFDRSGKVLGTAGAPDENGLLSPALSPDGRRVAVSRAVQGNLDIWLLDGARTSRFTFDAAMERDPVWSPDGSRVAFFSDRKRTRNLYMKPSSGAGSEELLLESPQDKTPNDWSADGRFMLYHTLDSQTAYDLWVLPLDGDRKPWVFLKTNFNERNGQFSPDGRWVAYMSNESGRYEIYVRPFAPPAASGSTGDQAGVQWQVSTAGGIFPRWRPDGKELYYIAPNGQMMAATITAKGTTLEPGTPVALFQTRIAGGGTDIAIGRNYDVSRDGRFLINQSVEEFTTTPITLILNWKPPAK